MKISENGWRVIGVLSALAVTGLLLGIARGYQKAKYPEVTSVYWLCNKDQISEMLVNQPNGMSAAIATHCELHTYERKVL